MDAHPIALSQPPQQGLGFKPRAAAVRAGVIGAVFGEEHPNVHLVTLGFEPVEKGPDPIPLSVLPGAFSGEHPLLLLPGEPLPGDIERDGAQPGEPDEILPWHSQSARIGRAGWPPRPGSLMHPAPPDRGRCRSPGRTRGRSGRRRPAELNENRVGVGSRYARSQSGLKARCKAQPRPALPALIERVDAHLAAAVFERGLQVSLIRDRWLAVRRPGPESPPACRPLPGKSEVALGREQALDFPVLKLAGILSQR